MIAREFFARGVNLGIVLLVSWSTSAMAAPLTVYEHYYSWSSDVAFIDQSEPASDAAGDTVNWEDRKEVGDLLQLAGTNRRVTQVDVLLGQWLNRSFTGDAFLKFYANEAGTPGAQFFEATTPISSSHAAGGALEIPISFTNLSQLVPDDFFYSVGVRNVVYTGGTGGWYLAHTGNAGAVTVGNSDAGYWELTNDGTWGVVTNQNANVRVIADVVPEPSSCILTVIGATLALRSGKRALRWRHGNG